MDFLIVETHVLCVLELLRDIAIIRCMVTSVIAILILQVENTSTAQPCSVDMYQVCVLAIVHV